MNTFSMDAKSESDGYKSAFLKLPGSSDLGLGERTVGSVLGAKR